MTDAPLIRAINAEKETTMTDAPELLPCPFCGGDDTYRTEDQRDHGFIGCNECHAQGPVVDLIGPKGWQTSDYAWNKRAASEARDKRVRDEALREAAEVALRYKERADARANVTRGVGKHAATGGHEAQSGAAQSIVSEILALIEGDQRDEDV